LIIKKIEHLKEPLTYAYDAKIYLCYPFSVQSSQHGDLFDKNLNSYTILFKMSRVVGIVKHMKEIVANDSKIIYSNVFITSEIRKIFLNFIHVENNKFELDGLYEK